MAVGDRIFNTWAGMVLGHNLTTAYSEYDKVRHTDGLVYRANTGGVTLGTAFAIGTTAETWTLMPRVKETRFTSSGTFTPDPHCIKTNVEAVGGGGGRMTGNHPLSNTYGTGAGGGSSGGYAKGHTDVPITVPTAVTIGVAGNGANGSITVLDGYFTCRLGRLGNRALGGQSSHISTHPTHPGIGVYNIVGFTMTVENLFMYTGHCMFSNYDLQTHGYGGEGGSNPLGKGGLPIVLAAYENYNMIGTSGSPQGYGSGAGGQVALRGNAGVAAAGRPGIMIFREELG